jgi:hypothetical protein
VRLACCRGTAFGGTLDVAALRLPYPCMQVLQGKLLKLQPETPAYRDCWGKLHLAEQLMVCTERPADSHSSLHALQHPGARPPTRNSARRSTRSPWTGCSATSCSRPASGRRRRWRLSSHGRNGRGLRTRRLVWQPAAAQAQRSARGIGAHWGGAGRRSRPRRRHPAGVCTKQRSQGGPAGDDVPAARVLGPAKL